VRCRGLCGRLLTHGLKDAPTALAGGKTALGRAAAVLRQFCFARFRQRGIDRTLHRTAASWLVARGLLTRGFDVERSFRIAALSSQLIGKLDADVT
jgi:hypothetical protein